MPEWLVTARTTTIAGNIDDTRPNLLYFIIQAPARDAANLAKTVNLSRTAPPPRNLEPILATLLFEDLQAGDTLIIAEGQNLTDLATITIDAKTARLPLSARKKMISHRYKRELNAIRQFLREAQRGGQAPGQNLLSALEAVALKRQEFRHYHVKAVWIGSPIIANPNPLFSMTHSRYPNDAHLLTGSDSIYSTPDTLKRSLAGVEVHIIHSPDSREFSPHATTRHRDKIRRFWSLLLGQRQGKLASFASNANHLARLRSTAFTPITFELDRSDTKLRSIQFQTPRELEAEHEREATLFAPVENISSVQTQPDTPQPLEIELRWNTPGVDLDLYVTIKGDDEELSYKRQASTVYRGRHHKDYRSRPGKGRFETVSYDRPLKLSDIQSIFVNVYTVRSRNRKRNNERIDAEIRIKHGEKLYAHSLVFTTSKGSKGAGNRRSHPAWKEIVIGEIIGEE